MYFGLRESARIVDCSVNDLRSLKKSSLVVPSEKGYSFDQLILVRVLELIKWHMNYESLVFASELNKLGHGLDECNFYKLEAFVYFPQVGYSPLYLMIKKIEDLPSELREAIAENCFPRAFSVDSDDEILNPHNSLDRLVMVTNNYKALKSKPKRGVVILSIPAILRFLTNQVIKEYWLEPEIVNDVKKGILLKPLKQKLNQDDEAFCFVGE